MDHLVAVLYFIGGALTIGAAFWAYGQARATLDDIESRIEQLRAAHREHDADIAAETERWEREIDPFRPDGFPADAAVQFHNARNAEIEAALVAAEVAGRSGVPQRTWGDFDMEPLPSNRDLAAAEVFAFRRQGVLALVGIVISTAASVWSVYL